MMRGVTVIAGVDFDLGEEAYAELERSPGPAAYDQPDGLGRRGITFSRAPYSGYRPPPAIARRAPPSPADYSPLRQDRAHGGAFARDGRQEDYGRVERSPGPKYKLHDLADSARGRPDPTLRRPPTAHLLGTPASAQPDSPAAATPGPDYTPNLDSAYYTAPRFSFPKQRRPKLGVATDGDRVRFRLGCSPLSLGARAPATSFGLRPAPRDLDPAPGPGAYDHDVRSRRAVLDGGKTIAGRLDSRPPPQSKLDPGPGAYDIPTTLVASGGGSSFGGGRPRNPRYKTRAARLAERRCALQQQQQGGQGRQRPASAAPDAAARRRSARSSTSSTSSRGSGASSKGKWWLKEEQRGSKS